MPGRKKRSWTVPELEILERHYREMSAAEIKRRYLPHRTINAIRNTASAIGAGKWKNKVWSYVEEGVVLRSYHDSGRSLYERLPGRTAGAVTAKAREMEVSTRWTSQEIDTLRREYPVGGVKTASQALPNKSESSVRSMARKLGIRHARKKGDGTNVLPWSECELRRLRENQNLKLGKLCELFPDRTKVSVKTMRQRIRRGRSDQSRQA